MATSNEDEDKPLVFCRGCRVAFKGDAPEDELHDNGGHCADLYERALLLEIATALSIHIGNGGQVSERMKAADAAWQKWLAR